MMRVLGVSIVLSFTACAFAVPEGRFACDDSTQCPAGWVCVAAHCYSSPPDAAASHDVGASLDVGAALDGASADAGTDAAARDAASDAGTLDAASRDAVALDLGGDTGCDVDGDTHTAIRCGGDDCNDMDASIHPGAAEACDGVDSNCNGQSDTMDSAARDTCFLRECLADHCERAVDVGAGDYACALLTTPRMACWGNGANGQFTGSAYGDATIVGIHALPVAGVQLAAAQNSLCYRDARSIVRCAGGGPTGDGNPGTATDTSADPIAAVGAMADVALSSSIGMSVDAMGVVYQWGAVVEPTTTALVTRNAPTALPMPLPMAATAVGAGYGTSCALLTDDTVRCWGSIFQSLGEAAAPPWQFVQPSVSGVVELAVGREYFACARLGNGDVSCWGDPPVAASAAPGTIPVVHDALAVRGGRGFACVLRSDHTVWCWGDNTHGALGNGMASIVAVTTPQPVMGLPPIAILGSAWDQICAIDMQGFVWCWGENQHGQASGDGMTADVLTPVRIMIP